MTFNRQVKFMYIAELLGLITVQRTLVERYLTGENQSSVAGTTIIVAACISMRHA